MSNVAKDPTLIHEPGIYFDMPEDVYHADTALGSSDIKLLATQPSVWQRNRIRPKANTTTKDMKWGAALHCRVLEGKEIFEERYAQKPKVEDLGKPGVDVLDTVSHMKAYLKQTRPSIYSLPSNKDELIDIVKAMPGYPIIFKDHVTAWEKKNRITSDMLITAIEMQEIEDAVYYLQQDEFLRPIMSAGQLFGGSPELSIFYEDRGVRRKARYDYAIPPLKTVLASTVADIKTFAQPKGENSEDAALWSLSQWDYDVQAIDYLNAWEFGKDLVNQGKLFGEEPFEGYAEKFFNAPAVQWIWVMIHKDGGFRPVTLLFRRDHDEYRQDQHFQAAEMMCADAIDNLNSYEERYGKTSLWPFPQQTPLVVTGDMIPGYRTRN